VRRGLNDILPTGGHVLVTTSSWDFWLDAEHKFWITVDPESSMWSGAIDMMALEDWTFSENVFRNVKGRNGGGRAAIFIWVRSRQVVVERNLIENCDRGVAFGNPGKSTASVAGERLVYVSDGIIRNNFIVGGRHAPYSTLSLEPE
jgi:hypothetical protein